MSEWQRFASLSSLTVGQRKSWKPGGRASARAVLACGACGSRPQEVTLAERGSASPVFLWDRERVVGSLVAERQLVLSWRVARVVEGRRR